MLSIENKDHRTIGPRLEIIPTNKDPYYGSLLKLASPCPGVLIRTTGT